MTDMGYLSTGPRDTRPVADFGTAPGQADAFPQGVKWPDTRAQLMHANRVATLGKMSASIVDEVNQPLAAIAANATASLRWLTRANPEVGETILAIREVLGEVERASGMIQRIRALARNNEPEMSKLGIGC